MPYTNCITLNQAIYDLDLFDDLKFSDVKQFYQQSKNLDFDDLDFEVDIQDVVDDDKRSICWNCVEISFYLDVEDYWGELKPKEFSKTIRYNTSSALALILLNLYEESDEESEEESDEESERIDVADEWSNYVVPRGEMPPEINSWHQEYLLYKQGKREQPPHFAKFREAILSANEVRVDEWINRDLLTPIEN
jgi:hypothetical protein